MQFPLRLVCTLLIMLPIACRQNDTTKIQVKGELRNIEGMIAQYPGTFSSDSIRIFLYEVPFGGESQPVQLDSAVVSRANGKFTLEALAPKQGLYDVMIENGPMIPVINDDPINLDIDLTDKDRYYTVTGSTASNKLRDFIFGYSQISTVTANAFKQLDSLKLANSGDSAILAATEEKNSSLDKLNNFLKESLDKAGNPLVAAFTLGMASRSFTPEEYDSALAKTITKYPTDANLQYLKNQLKEAQDRETQEQQPLWVGKPAPEMTMPDVNGKDISLSSFRGKYVLVDFWASWCGPCRMENPNVVKAYNQFKDKNFTILGVSLDKEKDDWLEAIKKDHLSWTHISDLAYWNSKSVDLFQFQGIPYNVLIDPQGIVIAESLRGNDLINKLGEVLK